jgi:signal recognition particle receptor subunit beta
MEILRIVITGGVGAGKTSLIRTISEIDVVDTDKEPQMN